MNNKQDSSSFFKKVLEDLDLQDWKLEWYKEESPEGYCWHHNKTIKIGPASENVKLLMLHEIAHIDTCLELNNKHSKEFWDKYDSLREKYLPGVDISESEKHRRQLNGC